DNTEGAHDQGKEYPGNIVYVRHFERHLIQNHTQDHRPDILGGGRLEQVCTTTGAVAHVVAHQVGDHGGVARIVFRYARFHLAHQVSAHVGGFRVNTASELGEQSYERC